MVFFPGRERLVLLCFCKSRPVLLGLAPARGNRGTVAGEAIGVAAIGGAMMPAELGQQLLLAAAAARLDGWSLGRIHWRHSAV